MAKMNPGSIDKTAFECLKQYFMFANKLQGKIEITGAFPSGSNHLDCHVGHTQRCGFKMIFQVNLQVTTRSSIQN